ncbi:MAG: HNH endonuclease [Promethearchaeota archaeon]
MGDKYFRRYLKRVSTNYEQMIKEAGPRLSVKETQKLEKEMLFPDNCPNCNEKLQYPYNSCKFCGYHRETCIHEERKECYPFISRNNGVICYKICNKYRSYKEINREESREGKRSIPKRVQREVWKRDQGMCVECGSKEYLEFDHIIPFSKGGSNTARNIQLLCANCNRKKSNNIGS